MYGWVNGSHAMNTFLWLRCYMYTLVPCCLVNNSCASKRLPKSCYIYKCAVCEGTWGHACMYVAPRIMSKWCEITVLHYWHLLWFVCVTRLWFFSPLLFRSSLTTLFLTPPPAFFSLASSFLSHYLHLSSERKDGKKETHVHKLAHTHHHHCAWFVLKYHDSLSITFHPSSGWGDNWCFYHSQVCLHHLARSRVPFY